MLGISFYPNKEEIAAIRNYLDKSYDLGYRYAFSSLLMTGCNVEKSLESFKDTAIYARQKGFYVVLDVNPSLLDQLHVSYNNLSFFKKLGASAIRLDANFDGLKESLISFDPAAVDLVLNISNNTGSIANISSYEPNFRRLTGCHNFYPQPFTGLDLAYFLSCTRKYKEMGLRTGAFISSQIAEDGPHTFNCGLPTLEMHRKLPLITQAKHLVATGMIDDIIIGNAFASDEELKEVAALNQDQLQLNIEAFDDLTETEKFILGRQHFNRGDINSYSIRSTFVRVEVKDQSIPSHHTPDKLFPGDITIGNDHFGQYKGELNIVKQEIPNVGKYKNKVGQVAAGELFLMNYITPWKKFVFEEKHS